MFEMDRFVNISEVHGIVKDSLHELYDKLAKSAKVANENRSEINRMDTVVKRCVHSVQHLGKLDKGMTLLFRQFKEHTMQIVEINAKARDDYTRFDHAHTRHTEKAKEFAR